MYEKIRIYPISRKLQCIPIIKHKIENCIIYFRQREAKLVQYIKHFKNRNKFYCPRKKLPKSNGTEYYKAS